MLGGVLGVEVGSASQEKVKYVPKVVPVLGFSVDVDGFDPEHDYRDDSSCVTRAREDRS